MSCLPPASAAPSPPTAGLRQNSIDPGSKWIIQKFGGTSVGKYAVKIAEEIVSNYIDRNKIAIVCSARSGSTKSLGTTNLLLRAASEALQRQSKTPDTPGTVTPTSRGLFGHPDPPLGSQSPNSSVDQICKEHIIAAKCSVQNPDILQELVTEIERDCDWLRSFLFAAQASHQIGLGPTHR
jgi:aspartate kinase